MKKTDSLERREAVVKAMPELFKSLGIDRNNLNGKSYILWIDTAEDVFNDLTSINSKGLTLKEEIIDRLFQKAGVKISSVEIRHRTPECNLNPSMKITVSDVDLFLEGTVHTHSISAPTKVMKAHITLASGSPGALKQPEGYVIDSEHAPYNIGRVIEPEDPINRVNDIEIVDETREYSSRSLAHIDYAENIGFYIQREKPTSTNTVEVIRKNTTKTLKNESATVVLLDSDRLKLRHVMLVFHIITE